MQTQGNIVFAAGRDVIRLLSAVKAFHYYFRQTDLWVPWQGMLQVALADLREGSPTFAQVWKFAG